MCTHLQWSCYGFIFQHLSLIRLHRVNLNCISSLVNLLHITHSLDTPSVHFSTAVMAHTAHTDKHMANWHLLHEYSALWIGFVLFLFFLISIVWCTFLQAQMERVSAVNVFLAQETNTFSHADKCTQHGSSLFAVLCSASFSLTFSWLPIIFLCCYLGFFLFFFSFFLINICTAFHWGPLGLLSVGGKDYVRVEEHRELLIFKLLMQPFGLLDLARFVPPTYTPFHAVCGFDLIILPKHLPKNEE